jgi:hypothetical protein
MTETFRMSGINRRADTQLGILYPELLEHSVRKANMGW